MFVSNSDLNLLKIKIQDNKSSIERLIIHEPNSPNIQLMCIAFRNGKRYPPIADKEKGSITFIVLEGKLVINTYDFLDHHKIKSQILLPKEIYKIPRNIYRETISISANETIFFEIIEGPFNPANRVRMKNKN